MRRRTRSLITIQTIFDRYRCGEVLLRQEYEYADGERVLGPSRRMALGASLRECAAEVWEFIFSTLLEMQSEAPEVALIIVDSSDGDWRKNLVEGFALAAAGELKIRLADAPDAPSSSGQLGLW